MDTFPYIKEQFLNHIRAGFDISDSDIARLDRMITYTTLDGKMNRAIVILSTTRDLCQERNLEFSSDRARKAIVLGWCIELLQAYFLVADDIMDKSITRRGKPCWYKQEDVQMDAVNDSIILESVLYFLIRHHFRGEPGYMTFVELFQETTLQTQIGQMLDLVSQPQGKKGVDVLNKFSVEGQLRIITYKTAFYSFYLPFAFGMILCDLGSDECLGVARAVAIEMGRKFQIQDDYLDCYADPEHLGKIGTDIFDHKCTWLVVQALERCSTEQRKVLEESLGQETKEDEARVKNLYNELELPKLYEEQEERSYEAIVSMVKKKANVVPACVFMPILQKIHKRTK